MKTSLVYQICEIAISAADIDLIQRTTSSHQPTLTSASLDEYVCLLLCRKNTCGEGDVTFMASRAAYDLFYLRISYIDAAVHGVGKKRPSAANDPLAYHKCVLAVDTDFFRVEPLGYKS
jgi:hypothetical protein